MPAGNELGKDFVSAFIALWWFCTRRPARVVTTSVKQDQLEDVLWGEIRRLVTSARVKLPIQYNHLKIRQLNEDGSLHPNSELVGQVSSTREGLLGRHSTAEFKPSAGDAIPRTLVIFDEASGIDDEVYDSTQTWADRKLIIGNCWPCNNFFFRMANAEARDVPRDEADPSKGFHRRIIRIRAEDSPNVRLAEAEIARGETPSGRTLVPGVKTWEKLQQNRKLWDEELQCIGLGAQFYKGKEVMLFPESWLAQAQQLTRTQYAQQGVILQRTAKGVGSDPGEGKANTSFAAADEHGVFLLESYKTPDTNQFVPLLLAFCRRAGLREDQFDLVILDRGGGGKQHADRLRAMGFQVRTVAFGESVTLEMRRGHQIYRPWKERMEVAEGRYVYVNRRAQLYGELSLLLDPTGGLLAEHLTDKLGKGCVGGERGFGLPWRGLDAAELVRQLGLMPRLFDAEGRLRMLPKRKNKDNSKERTLEDVLGRSPDEADAVVLAVHALLHPPHKARAGVG